jgi:hypothetical protein
VLQELRARSRGGSGEEGQAALQGYAAAVEAYCHQLQAAGQVALPEVNTRVLLRVLQVGAGPQLLHGAFPLACCCHLLLPGVWLARLCSRWHGIVLVQHLCCPP